MPDPYAGEIRFFAGSFEPIGWAFCDGRILSAGDYADLYSVIGNRFGGTAPASFALPDLRGRVAVGMGQGPGLASRSLGEKGGAELAVVAEHEMPVHSHQLTCTNELAETRDPKGKTLASGLVGYNAQMIPKDMSEQCIGSCGKGQGHYNLQKFLCVHFIIALTGRSMACAASGGEGGR